VERLRFAEDTDLVARIGQGSEEALGELYDRYHRQCFSFAIRILGSERDAEDALQETFVRVWRHAGRFDAVRGGVTTWLFSIVRNLCVDELRKRRLRAPAGDVYSMDIPDDARTDDHVERAVLGEQVRDALRSLPSDQRRAIELVYYQGLTSQEVGNLLDTPPGTVRSRLRLGLLRLSSIMEAKGALEA
jgi:RNA polymerase sigma-70 factor (ECF subfamily)